MKQFVYITLLVLYGLFDSHAQDVSPWEDVYYKLPKNERDEFYKCARYFLENTFYTQMTLAIEEGMEFRTYFIEDIFGDKNDADAPRFQPEFLPESGKHRFLTPKSYLQILSNAFNESDNIEFVISNIKEDKYVHGYNSLTSCFTQLEYDLEIKRQEETLLKRRCRMYCLFPKVDYKREIRLMQIEPLEDIYFASETSKTKILNEYYNNKISENKDTAKLFIWGYRYEYGIGIPKDEKKAVEWYKKAAEMGDAGAQNNLGNCYRNGIGVTKDEIIAVEWYKKAADKGDAGAQNNLGNCYRSGIGVTKDEIIAVEWYKKAADKGNAEAQNNLGYCYQYGIGLPNNLRKAVEWYKKAADKGNAGAEFNLGFYYQYGLGDIPEATEWYKKAADKGDFEAIYNLRCCYNNDIGITKNETEAIEWYTKTVDKEHTITQTY